MRLMVGIPVLDEEKTIGDVVRQVPAHIAGISAVDIVVLDDGSRDSSEHIATEAGATVVRHASTQGVGSAFRTLVEEALRRGVDLLVTIDGDGQFNPSDIAALVAPILAGNAHFCTASRFADPALSPKMPWIKTWGNHRIAGLVSSLAKKKLHDVSCGFRAYSREALSRMTAYHSFTYTHETILDIAAKRMHIVEVPLSVRGTRQFGRSRVAANVFAYAWRTALIILRFYRDMHPLALCSYVALPVALAGALLLAASLHHLLQAGAWIKWAGFGGGALIGLSIAIVFFGFMADMLCRLRLNQEELIYWTRRAAMRTASMECAPPRTVAGSRADPLS